MKQQEKETYTQQLKELYNEMEQAYGKIATLLDFSCTGCPDNCCDSYFLHYTYIEWLYLLEGLQALPEEQQEKIRSRARAYVSESKNDIIRGERPTALCPLNEDGLCGLYTHRLMICRLHGVPASMVRPDGQEQKFPGCFRCQELTEKLPNVPTMTRTPFFKKMVQIEQALLAEQESPPKRIKKTIADMLLEQPF